MPLMAAVVTRFVLTSVMSPWYLTSTLSTGISINHVISIFAAWAGGWVWQAFGVEWLFVFAGVMCVANSLCAMTIPRVPARPAGEVTA